MASQLETNWSLHVTDLQDLSCESQNQLLGRKSMVAEFNDHNLFEHSCTKSEKCRHSYTHQAICNVPLHTFALHTICHFNL